MNNKFWKTGTPVMHQGLVRRPSLAQLLKQIALIAVIGAIWAGVLIGVLSVTGIAAENVAIVGTESGTSTPRPRVTKPAVSADVTATNAAPATSTVAVSSTPPAVTATVNAVTVTIAPTKPASTPPTPAPASSDGVSFSRDVLPIFTRVCVKCHGGEETKEGLVLKTYADVMAGSDNGSVVEPGDPANSQLIDLITKGKMPKKGPHLLPAEIRTISDWVKAGALNN